MQTLQPLTLILILLLLRNVQCQFNTVASYYSTIAAAFGVFGGIALLIILILVIVKKCRSVKRTLKKRYNEDSSSMTEDAYNKSKDLILIGLHSGKINNVFWSYNDKNEASLSTVIDLSSKNEEPFLT